VGDGYDLADDGRVLNLEEAAMIKCKLLNHAFITPLGAP